MAELTNPLRQLLSGNTKFILDRPQQDAFDKIKDVITREPGPVLAYFDPNKAITIKSDASKHGLGCVLLHDGRPVCLASKSLTLLKLDMHRLRKNFMQYFSHAKGFIKWYMPDA